MLSSELRKPTHSSGGSVNPGIPHAEVLVHGLSFTHRWASPFSLFSPFSPFSPSANVQLPFVSYSANGQTTNFRLHDEKEGNGIMFSIRNGSI
jgi:hypothetical protein